MTKKRTKEELFIEIRTAIDEIRAGLPDSINAKSFKTKSLLPFKVMSSAGALGRRFVDLADDALFLFERGKVVSPSILSRSCIETVSMVFLIHKKMVELIENSKHKNIDDFDEFIMKQLFGSKTNPDVPDAYNVLTAIQHLDKTYQGIEKSYYSLSEIAHPNWPGTHGAYTKLDDDHYYLSFKEGKISPMQGLFLLSGSTKLMQYYWHSIVDELNKLICLCQEADTAV